MVPNATVVIKLTVVANMPVHVDVFSLTIQEELAAIAAAVQNRTAVEILRSASVMITAQTFLEVLVVTVGEAAAADI